MRYSIQCKSQEYLIEPFRVLTIGRSIDSFLRLFEDPAVSRVHCVISLRGDALIIEDQAGADGTYVNGRAIRGPTELHDGDSIIVGATELKVRIRSLAPNDDPEIRL